jgi:mRNA-degrading endonuclease RelE of RelBE toxin-antitoxin system
MTFAIKLHSSAAAELKQLRVYDQRRIAEAIDKHLRDQATIASRNRKCLKTFTPTFEHVPPIWELRVGDFRVFYDFNEESQIVNVRAIREKARRQSTEEIA